MLRKKNKMKYLPCFLENNTSYFRDFLFEFCTSFAKIKVGRVGGEAPGEGMEVWFMFLWIVKCIINMSVVCRWLVVVWVLVVVVVAFGELCFLWFVIVLSLFHCCSGISEYMVWNTLQFEPKGKREVC